jgi:arylsulfatase A-like enzyme
MKVLVVAVSGLHLGFLGCYGNEWIATPALDRLATEGVVFDQHLADCPEAAAARRAWRTGCYQLPTAASGSPAAADTGSDLLDLLRSRRIPTTLVVDASRPSPADFAAGWDHLVRVTPAPGETPLEATLEAALGALDRLADSDHWLLWVELAPLLPPWEVPDSFRDPYFMEDAAEDEEPSEDEAVREEEPLTPLPDPPLGFLGATDRTTFLRLQRTYAAAVTFLDAGLGQLYEELHDRDLLDDLFLLVTTDRGQALGEHGLVGESPPWLHEELVHLALLARLPGGAEAGRRVPALTQPVDLLPTLLEAFGVSAHPVHGQSLWPLLRGEAEQVRAYACSGGRVGPSVEWALRTPDWALLLPVQAPADEPARAPQLYVKPDDRWEVNNVLQHHLELAEHLEQTLRGFVEATRGPGPFQAPALRDVEVELAAAGTEPNPIEEGTQP